MVNFISDIRPDNNFWEDNPQLKYISEFKELYDLDKTKDKSFSSKQLWAVALFSDAAKSTLYAMPEEDRKNEIIENVLTSQHKWEDLKKAIEAYPKHCMSKKQRVFKSWGDKLDEFERFIATQKYNMGNWDDVSKMQKSFLDLLKLYNTMEKEVTDESKKGITEGKRKESKSETQEI